MIYLFVSLFMVTSIPLPFYPPCNIYYSIHLSTFHCIHPLFPFILSINSINPFYLSILFIHIYIYLHPLILYLSIYPAIYRRDYHHNVYLFIQLHLLSYASKNHGSLTNIHICSMNKIFFTSTQTIS